MRRLPWLGVLVAAACGTTAADTIQVRPPEWAQPVIGSDVDNWFRVTPELYRCGQPSARGMRTLAAFGIQTVVNLREYHSDAGEVEGTALRLVEVPVGADELTYEHVVAALRAVLQADKPVVVHCWQGADRTGAVVAADRIAVEGWTPAVALAEMAGGGFGHSVLYENLRQLVAGLDRERLRRDVGLPPR